MTTEAVYADGSHSSWSKDGGSFHTGDQAINRLRLITARSALSIYIKYEGRMELTRGGAAAAIANVIAPMTGKAYKRSMNGKREALADCEALLAALESGAVIYTEARCDVCGALDVAVEWCGNCGNCREHCADHEGCDDES